MSQKNMEVVWRSYEGWNAGAMDVVRECYDPDATLALEPETSAEVARSIVGIDALMRFYARLREAWDTDVMEPISFVDAGNRVVVHHVWRAKGSGPDLDIDMEIVCTLRHGRICLVEPFPSEEEALKAVGLEK